MKVPYYRCNQWSSWLHCVSAKTGQGLNWSLREYTNRKVTGIDGKCKRLGLIRIISFCLRLKAPFAKARAKESIVAIQNADSKNTYSLGT